MTASEPESETGPLQVRGTVLTVRRVDAYCAITIVAPGIAAPVVSVTVPKMDPYTDCALAGATKRKLAQAQSASTSAVRNILFMRSPERKSAAWFSVSTYHLTAGRQG